MNTCIDIDNVSDNDDVPEPESIRRWASSALTQLADAELSIRIVNEDEITDLNSRYRDKNKATNVLSFPADLPEEIDIPLLGDIIICASVVNQEALEQNKTVDAHWAHMTIHGVLHLMGYDHIEDEEAEEMEALETRLLQQLGFPAPYEEQG
jgi:probable rRNA maturation factor